MGSRSATRRVIATAGLLVLLAAGCSSDPSHVGRSSSRTAGGSPASTTPVLPAATSTQPSATPGRTTARPTSSKTGASSSGASSTGASTRAKSPAAHSGRLPLDLSTGDATQIITVSADSRSSTIAVLRTWRHSGSGWVAVGPAVQAHLGSAGVSTQPSESSTATPIGSFTLTQAFGRQGNPGTRLPYVHTTPDDWWISQSGSLYNTRQHCASDCAFTRGDPNEHLYYETPYYNYAAVIDYNTANAPGGVRAGKGSAFFLHVTDGRATAGCISVPQADLVRILTWLSPAQHPRILIGVG